MDGFGVKYSVPPGTGSVSESTVQFTIPYPNGAFHDTFIYSPEMNTWLFVLEAAQPNGKWKHFARYTVRRP